MQTETKTSADQLKAIGTYVGVEITITDDGHKAHVLFGDDKYDAANNGYLFLDELQEELDRSGYDYIIRKNALGGGHYVIIDIDKREMSRKDIDAVIEQIPFMIDHLGNVSQRQVDFDIHPLVEQELQRRWDLLLAKAKTINA